MVLIPEKDGVTDVEFLKAAPGWRDRLRLHPAAQLLRQSGGLAEEHGEIAHEAGAKYIMGVQSHFPGQS